MAKRKGSSTSRPRTRSKTAKEGREAKISDKGIDDKEFHQLTREFQELDGKRAKFSKIEHELEGEVKDEQRKLEYQKWRLEEQRRKVEEQRRKLEEDERKVEELKRDMEEQLKPLRREVEKLEQDWRSKRNLVEDMCSAREAENTQRCLDKLPPEVWGKILGNLDENDLFSFALSCRYFRQKQKELVARTRQSGPERRLALKTNLKRKLWNRQPASADYLRFCSKEKVPRDFGQKRDEIIRTLAAFHGYLPLLQELPKSKTKEEIELLWITRSAGESSSSQSHLLLYFDF